MEQHKQCATILARLVDLLREEARPALRTRITAALPAQDTEALRFLQDLDIFVNMPGPDFIYSRGIAETLRVGEDIFELAYVMKQAMR